jgi:hypothetical protein
MLLWKVRDGNRKSPRAVTSISFNHIVFPTAHVILFFPRFIHAIIWVSQLNSAGTSWQKSGATGRDVTSQIEVITISNHTFKDTAIFFGQVANFLWHYSSKLITNELEVRHVSQCTDFCGDCASELVVWLLCVESEKKRKKNEQV